MNIKSSSRIKKKKKEKRKKEEKRRETVPTLWCFALWPGWKMSPRLPFDAVFASTCLYCKLITCDMRMILRNYRLPVASVTHTKNHHKCTGNILHPSARKNSTVCFLLYEHWEPLTAWKTRLMFCGLWMCVDLADMLSLWCCNPVTNSVLYLLVGIWFLASVALNYNHFSL